jgi:hypothetical protein
MVNCSIFMLMLDPGVQQVLVNLCGTSVRPKGMVGSQLVCYQRYGWFPTGMLPKVRLVPSWYVIQDNSSRSEWRSMDTLV